MIFMRKLYGIEVNIWFDIIRVIFMAKQSDTRTKENTLTKRVTTAGVFVALALIFGYVESLIPFNFGVPGIKLGLANVVVVTALYMMKLPDTILISVIRIVVSGLLFGNLMSLAYSLAGGVLSLLIMILLKKTEKFSVIGVSIAGGVLHNTGQILMAMILTGVSVISYYLPVLIGVGILTGFLIGIVSGRVLMIFERSTKISF